MAFNQSESHLRDSPESSLTAAVTDLLLADPVLGRQTHQALTRFQREQGLVIQDRLLCQVMRPRFLNAERVAALRRQAETLAAAYERAGQALLTRDRLLDAVGAGEAERELWAVDPGYPGFTVTSRLDCFMMGTSPRVVEYNAESPAGIGYCDTLSAIFEQLPVMHRWDSDFPLQPFACLPHLFDTLLWAFHAWGGAGTPSVAIIDWADVITRRDFEICAEYFRAQGMETVIVDPRAIEYRQGKVEADGQPVSLVYRRVLLHELLDREAEVRPLLTAYREGAICMVNSPRSKLLHKKTVVALLSDGSLDMFLRTDERKMVHEAIPWTRRLLPGPSTYEGSPIDLLPFALQAQDRLALKPNDDYGGRGVVLGWTVSPQEWERALHDAMGAQYILQERVPVPTSSFPVWQEQEVVLGDFYVDTDPLLFRGRMGGVLTRISDQALLNVTAGAGSSVPTFQVGER